MSLIKATNNFVFIKRDESILEKAGLRLPDMGQEKPHRGIIYSVGELVQDKTIKKGKSALWHQGNGQEVPIDDEVYLVIEGERIICVI